MVLMTPALVALATCFLSTHAWPLSAGPSGGHLPAPDECRKHLLPMFACYLSLVEPRIIGTPSPSAPCCAAFSAVAFDGAGGGAACLCHLIWDPTILGFSVNDTVLLNLFPSCAISHIPAMAAATSFIQACQGSPEFELRDVGKYSDYLVQVLIVVGVVAVILLRAVALYFKIYLGLVWKWLWNLVLLYMQDS